VPISTALTNIACGLFALLLLSTPEFWRKLPSLRRHGAAMATLVLFAALAGSTFYSTAGLHEAWSWMGKYLKLLLVPFAILAFADSEWDGIVRWALFATLSTTLALSTTNYLGLTHIGPSYIASDPVAHALVFRNRIANGLFGALLFYQAADLALAAPGTRARLIYAGIAALSLANVLIMLQGRTGQVIVVLFALAVAARAAWHARRRLKAWTALGAAALLVVTISLVAYACTMHGSRIREVAGEVQAYRQSDAITSTGLRLEWYAKCLELIRARPLAGYGAGGLGAEFAKLTKDETGAKGIDTQNPHNEYLLMAVQLGIPGALLFVNMLVQIGRRGARLTPHSRQLLLAWLAAFAIGSLANSLLLDFAEGHMFALLSGILLGCGYRSGARSVASARESPMARQATGPLS
jgi:O-antigen ligase